MHRHVSTVLGLLAVALGMTLWVIMTLQLKHISPPSLENSSVLTKLLAHPPAPKYISLYVFNFTNYDTWALNPNSTVTVSECGPYVFRVETTKSLTWSAGNLTISERMYFYFEPSLSIGSLDDTIWTVNYVYLLPHKLMDKKKAAEQALFVLTSVGDYFYNGFDDIIINDKWWPLATPDGKPAWFGQLNTSVISNFTVKTASGFVNQIIAVHNNGNNSRLTFCGDLVGKIAGSELMPAFWMAPESIDVYYPTLCALIRLRLKKQYILDSQEIALYTGGQDLFNATAEVCVDSRLIVIKGTLNASFCYGYGPHFLKVVPVVLSLPHFLHGDSKLRSTVAGLNPDETKHGFHVHVHAPSGVVVDSKLRTQINLNLSLKGQHTPLILPIFWQEIARLPKSKEKMLAFVKPWPVFAGYTAFACGLSFLAAAALFGISIFVEGPIECCDEDLTPHTPDDIPTEELSSESETDLRREQRRRALRARLPAGLPVYFKIHKGDLDDLGVDIPDWVMEKLQAQMDEQGSSSSSEDSSDELTSAVGSSSWSTVSSRSTSPVQQPVQPQDASQSSPEPDKSQACSEAEEDVAAQPASGSPEDIENEVLGDENV